MRSVVLFFAGFLSLFALSACSSNDTPTIQTIVEEEVSQLLSQPGYSAVSGVVILNGDSYSVHKGVLENDQRPDDFTLYEIGSLTKTYTGLLLAQAVNDGHMNLDDPVSIYLPNMEAAIFQRQEETATIRDLATHTSGLPVNLTCTGDELTVDERLDCFRNYDRELFFSFLSQSSLQDRPGTQYRYSNAGIRLLSHILEDVYDSTYPDLLDRFIFPRTGETDTHFRTNPSNIDRLAIGHNETGSIMPNASDYYFGAGALKTSTESFAQYLAFYLDDENALSRNALTLLAGDPDGLGRAYVWNTFRLETEGMYYHSGGTFGTSSWVALYPRESLGIFLVSPYVSPNAQGELNETANRIVERLRTLMEVEAQ